MRLSRVIAPFAATIVLAGSLLALPGTAEAAKKGGGKGSSSVAERHRARLFELRGLISDIDLDHQTVTVRVKRHKKRAVPVTVRVATNARIQLNDAAATLEDLAEGDRVQVRGRVRQVEGSLVLTALRLTARGDRDLPDPEPTDETPTPSTTETATPTGEPTSTGEPTPIGEPTASGNSN
jgi:hypothetical protein